MENHQTNSIKFHKPLTNAVNSNLLAIFNQGKQADKVIEHCFKSNKSFGKRDRAFIAETTYDIVRYIRLYHYCLKSADTFSGEANKQYYGIMAVYFILKNIPLPNWPEFNGLNPKLVLYNAKEAKLNFALHASIPDWLHALGSTQINNWQSEMNALNNAAKVVIRVNTLKTNKQQLVKLLQEQNIATEILTSYNDALLVKNRVNLFTTDAFKQGFFEMQDANSQLIAPFLNPKPGDKVIDACCGAGGKALHLAALMQNKGKLICLDTEEWKLTELKKRAQRAGVQLVETKLVNEHTVSKLNNFADKLLLDVPCSGLGVLKRNPDSKWKLNLAWIEEIRKTQQQKLTQYAKMLKIGGTMVYATCSILPEENQQQVKHFLEHNACFTLEEEKVLSPSETGFDGFYMARLVKTGQC